MITNKQPLETKKIKTEINNRLWQSKYTLWIDSGIKQKLPKLKYTKGCYAGTDTWNTTYPSQRRTEACVTKKKMCI